MMHYFSRRVVLVALCTTLGLAACASAPPSTNEAPVPSDTSPVTLTLWHAQNGNARNLLTTFIADFQKTYPWITINADAKNSDGDLLKFGIAAMALNQPPDLLIAPPRSLAEFARYGKLASLDPFFAQEKIGFGDEERSDFFPGLLDSARIGEPPSSSLAFPFDAHLIVMYYDANLLQAAKISGAPKTWDDFSAAARATTRGDVRGWAMSPSPVVYSAMLASRGSSVLDDTQTKIQFTDGGGQATIQYIAGLARGGAAYLSDKPEQARDDFVQGKTAFLFGSLDDYIPLADAIARANKNFVWGAAMLPQNDPAHPASSVYGSAIGIFRTTDAKTSAAWLFARWLAAPEQTARWSRATLAMPLRISALGILAKDAATNPLAPLVRSGFGDVPPTVRSLPTVTNAAQIDAAVVEMWTTVGNGADPNTASSRAVARIQRVLGEGQK